MDKKDLKKGEIVIYKTPQNEVELKVKLEQETVWLSLHQMTLLFNRDKSVISRHIKNIFQEKELEQDSVVANFATTAADGKTYQVDYYNLDMIISVGYRIKSQIGVKFRIWASKILKQYLIKGYAIHEKQLLEAKNKFDELKETVLFLQKQSKKTFLKGEKIKILDLLADYSKTLSLLAKETFTQLLKIKLRIYYISLSKIIHLLMVINARRHSCLFIFWINPVIFSKNQGNERSMITL